MRAGARAAAAAAGWLAACASSGGGRHPEPPDPDVRIWVPTVVHWTPGTDRTMRFALENATQRTLPVVEPDPDRARVAIFAGAGSAQACGVEPGDPAPGGTVSLAPGDQLPVRVDLGEACRDLRPGEYRYELSYRLPPSDGRAGVALPTRYGTLVVEGPPRAAARGSSAAPRAQTPRAP